MYKVSQILIRDIRQNEGRWILAYTEDYYFKHQEQESDLKKGQYFSNLQSKESITLWKVVLYVKWIKTIIQHQWN